MRCLICASFTVWTLTAKDSPDAVFTTKKRRLCGFTRTVTNATDVDKPFLDACAKINSDFNLGLPIGKKLSLRQQRDAERAAKERKDKREAERAHYQSLKDDWFKWLKCWDTLDRYITELAPKEPEDDIDPLYTLAVKNIAYANYMLDEAEMRLKDYANRPKNNSSY